jgi:hypothetical protein
MRGRHRHYRFDAAESLLDEQVELTFKFGQTVLDCAQA